MNRNRPVNLDLTTIRFPLPAITSILHRISGVFLLIGMGFLIWLFSLSMEGRQGFDSAMAVLSGGFARFALWVTLSAVAYHLVAGVKHLVMDLGFAETKMGGQLAAVATLLVAAVLIVLAGVWVWA